MGKKAKSSRKGKKAWRANISTEDIEHFFEKSTKDALSGGSLSSAPSDSLFVLDRSRERNERCLEDRERTMEELQNLFMRTLMLWFSAIVLDGNNVQDLSVRRKIEKHREKVLRCDSLLEKNPFVQPVPSSTVKKTKRMHKEVSKANDATEDCPKGDYTTASGMDDIWDEKGEGNSDAKKRLKPSIIPAVEVEPPGCSFNPSVESHQEVLAHAVAEEMQKVYQKELGPQPVPLTVPGEVINEEDMYFIEADKGSDDDETNLETLGVNEESALDKRSSRTKRLTRVELNRRARQKEKLKKEAEARRVDEISKEIDCLPDIIHEIAKEDEKKQKRHLRRVVAKQERLKSCPPRLGRHKYEPAPVQVLLSEEITGSLRKLKGCCTLVKDRYKSLEKRGLVIPTVKSRK